ncbi:MaoC/PaaZ C-terminal domain-containing protein [Cupriavidus basilensis]
MTGDRQWIHVDPARAAADSPYGCTIAHGLLTLSMVTAAYTQSLQPSGPQAPAQLWLRQDPLHRPGAGGCPHPRQLPPGRSGRCPPGRGARHLAGGDPCGRSERPAMVATWLLQMRY